MITVDLRPGKQNRPKFLLSTSLLTKSCPQIWGCVNQSVYTFYASYLRRNSTIYHTDLGKNAVFHNFPRQIAVSQYSGSHGLSAKAFKKCPKWPIRPAGSHIWRAPNLQSTLTELLFNIIKNLLRLLIFFLFNGFIAMCNLEKRLMRAAFWILLHAMSMNDWKQTAQRLKLQERLLTINKRNIIPWNIYSDNNFHSRRQVLKCF